MKFLYHLHDFIHDFYLLKLDLIPNETKLLRVSGFGNVQCVLNVFHVAFFLVRLFVIYNSIRRKNNCQFTLPPSGEISRRKREGNCTKQVWLEPFSVYVGGSMNTERY